MWDENIKIYSLPLEYLFFFANSCDNDYTKEYNIFLLRIEEKKEKWNTGISMMQISRKQGVQ